MNVKLVVVQGKPEGKEILLRTAKFLIGRGAECHLRPNSELISRHHCMIVIGENLVTLRDLGSTNGTLVNGERIEGEVTICHEDLIQLGPLGFRLVMDAVPANVPAAVQPLVPIGAPPARGRMMSTAHAGALGAKDANETEVEQWLRNEAQQGPPGTSHDSFDGDTELHLNTVIDRRDDQDTQSDLTPPLPEQPEPADKSGEEYVTLESGRQVKVGNARAQIDKSREDTSRAAADILRRMMERRPGQ